MQNQAQLQSPLYLKPIGIFSRWMDNESRLGPAMVIPAVLIVVCMIAYPFGRALWLSVTDERIARPETGNYIGMENFENLWSRSTFHDKALPNTLKYTFGAVILKLGLGMGLALLLNRAIPFQNPIRAVILIPWVVPTSLSLMAWRWMLDSNYSVINFFLEDVGVSGAPFNWLGEPALALNSLMAVNIWRGTPFFAVTLLAALQIVPEELLEAAQIDGANVWHRFRSITLPTIFPVVVVTTLFSLVRTMADLEVVWLLTQGGPFNSTHLLSSYSYLRAIQDGRLGEAAAISLYLFPFFLVLVFLQLRYLQKRAD